MDYETEPTVGESEAVDLDATGLEGRSGSFRPSVNAVSVATTRSASRCAWGARAGLLWATEAR